MKKFLRSPGPRVPRRATDTSLELDPESLPKASAVRKAKLHKAASRRNLAAPRRSAPAARTTARWDRPRNPQLNPNPPRVLPNHGPRMRSRAPWRGARSPSAHRQASSSKHRALPASSARPHSTTARKTLETLRCRRNPPPSRVSVARACARYLVWMGCAVSRSWLW